MSIRSQSSGETEYMDQKVPFSGAPFTLADWKVVIFWPKLPLTNFIAFYGWKLKRHLMSYTTIVHWTSKWHGWFSDISHASYISCSEILFPSNENTSSNEIFVSLNQLIRFQLVGSLFLNQSSGETEYMDQKVPFSGAPFTLADWKAVIFCPKLPLTNFIAFYGWKLNRNLMS